MLDGGSTQADLLGINIYPSETGDELIEFDSMINVRPAQSNRSRSVEDGELRARIRTIVASLVADDDGYSA